MNAGSTILAKLATKAREHLYRPSIAVEPGGPLEHLGSDYGGWTIEAAPYLHGGTVVSCGLGLDASFDAEIAQKFGATVTVVDPTPGAIEHFEQMRGRLGHPASTGYVAGGTQPVEAYDLSRVAVGQLRLVPKAFWTDRGPVRFNKPSNGAFISHSIKFDAATGFMLVPAVTFAELTAEAGEVAILKMDIEGAEIEVLGTVGQWPALPRQILVEFDVLREPGEESKRQVERIDALLREHGYRCRHAAGRNYLYVRVS